MVISVVGEHDISNLPLLNGTLASAISADGAEVVVDLSGVTFLDASTIGALIRARNTLRHQSRSLTLRSPSRCAGRLLDLCGMTGLVEANELPVFADGTDSSAEEGASPTPSSIPDLADTGHRPPPGPRPGATHLTETTTLIQDSARAIGAGRVPSPKDA